MGDPPFVFFLFACDRQGYRSKPQRGLPGPGPHMMRSAADRLQGGGVRFGLCPAGARGQTPGTKLHISILPNTFHPSYKKITHQLLRKYGTVNSKSCNVFNFNLTLICNICIMSIREFKVEASSLMHELSLEFAKTDGKSCHAINPAITVPSHILHQPGVLNTRLEAKKRKEVQGVS